MSPSPCCRGDARLSAAEANERMRALSKGRVRPEDWTAEDLAELARLQGEWRAAVARERLVRAA